MLTRVRPRSRHVIYQRGALPQKPPLVFWSVPREWEGETCFVIAGGPSVRDQPIEQLRGRKVIAINSSWARASFADFLFFGDRRWWKKHQASVLADFPGRIVTTNHHAPVIAGRDRILLLHRVPAHFRLSKIPHSLVMDKTSTYAALNLAFLLGAKRIVLLGADMQKAEDGRKWHHDPHQWEMRPEVWLRQMKQLELIRDPLIEAGVEVINASPRSLINFWPKASLEEFLTCP